jgi:undecaprenyl-phosphate galactose phosphotransferase
VLILGAGNAGKLVMEGIEREKHMGFDVVGFLDDDEQKKGMLINGKKVFGAIKHFSKFVKELGINTIIISMPSLNPDKLSAITAEVQSKAINTMVIPDLKGIALLNTELFHLFYEEIFLMNIRNNLKSVTNRFIKRLFDTVVSIVLLPFLLTVIGIIGLIIRLETSGPAMYVHERIGKCGKTFRCYKFRTMYKNSEEKLNEILTNEEIRTEWENSWKLKDDPRITRIGRFLRKTSLDELPQIFNVLKGEMSLVGPRPVTQEEVEKYYRESAELCFSVLPGISGLWQVSGRNNTSYEYRLKLDAWYVMNWSLWLDIAILFRTLKVVAKMEGAY